MTLKDQIKIDFKKAFLAKDSLRKSVLEGVLSEIKNKEIEKKKREEGLDNEEVVEILSRLLKQRLEAVSQYQKGGRKDLAEKEEKEALILREYLPKQLSAEEIKERLKLIISKVGAKDKSDFGKVMGFAMKELRGQVDGSQVRKILEELLG